MHAKIIRKVGRLSEEVGFDGWRKVIAHKVKNYFSLSKAKIRARIDY